MRQGQLSGTGTTRHDALTVPFKRTYHAIALGLDLSHPRFVSTHGEIAIRLCSFQLMFVTFGVTTTL
jgi:hypothetical protein